MSISDLSIGMLCSPLRNPVNGIIFYANGKTIGDEVHYRCDENYELVGSPIRRCAGNRIWVPEEPYCMLSKFYMCSQNIAVIILHSLVLL